MSGMGGGSAGAASAVAFVCCGCVPGSSGAVEGAAPSLVVVCGCVSGMGGGSVVGVVRGFCCASATCCVECGEYESPSLASMIAYVAAADARSSAHSGRRRWMSEGSMFSSSGVLPATA